MTGRARRLALTALVAALAASEAPAADAAGLVAMPDVCSPAVSPAVIRLEPADGTATPANPRQSSPAGGPRVAPLAGPPAAGGLAPCAILLLRAVAAALAPGRIPVLRRAGRLDAVAVPTPSGRRCLPATRRPRTA